MSAIDITWPGGEHTFDLRIGHLRALQDKCDAGPAWVLARLRSGQWRVDDVVETIRLGLEGGGLEKREARRLVTMHVEEAPLQLSVATAQIILMAALYGNGEGSDDPVGEAAGEGKTAPQASPEESGASPSSTETASPSA